MGKVMNFNIFGAELLFFQDWICKTVMALQLYATVASISWMFVQGHYLHSRVTTNVFDRGTPFRAYFGIGWGNLQFLASLFLLLAHIGIAFLAASLPLL